MARRGSYAKGIAKRDEILERALEVVATEGYGGASVKRIAEAVGLSQAGLLHYFDSKEELFTEVLRKRDQRDSDQFSAHPEPRTADMAGIRSGYVRVIRHNTEVPGLVELFSRLAVDAADHTHPAHRYFIERGDMLREALTRLDSPPIAEPAATDAGTAQTLTPDMVARVLQAVADGLQLQWLLDPSVDMAEIVDRLFAVLIPQTTAHPGPTNDE